MTGPQPDGDPLAGRPARAEAPDGSDRGRGDEEAPGASPADRRGGPAGTSTFTIEGRAAPGLFVFGWVLTLVGLGATMVGFLSAGSAASGPVLLAGLVILDAGLILGAGGQAIERRARGRDAYRGPSPVLLLLISVVTVPLVAVVVGVPLGLAGISLPAPVRDLLTVAIHAATYAGVIRLLVVGTGALSWREIGLVGPRSRVLSELAWGILLAGPVVLGTAVLSAILLALLRVTPPSPLPATGTPWGLVLNLVSGAVLAPIGEELLFRGVATTAWVRSLGASAGVLRAALLFALMHVLFLSGDTFGQAAGIAVTGFVGRLPVALVLGWAFVRRGSLWAPIGLHAAFNAILLVLGEVAAGAG